ncbi:MAG: hypothetical protein A2V67_18900 [Deltaproteobacteria bacterium RBG_13_61_14]|nr:MAG: hypothetical protein A2V67_18900 [Deltaproteobacteria bacterium RBG_13_61_14]
MTDIKENELHRLRKAFAPLIGLRITWLSIPEAALVGFEPSQIAVIVNTLLDAILPQIQFLASDKENAAKLAGIGLSKAPGIKGQRETYPDYLHVSGRRVELKGLFVDNPDLALKRPPTDREPSARIKENVTMEIIDPANDALLVAAVKLLQDKTGRCSPYVIDIGVFSMVECVRARDASLAERGGKWIGGIPKVVKKSSMSKFKASKRLQNSDFEKDTNFGKLKRIPYPPLQEFMRKHGAI